MTTPTPDEFTEAEWLGLKTGAPLLPYRAYVDLVHDYVYEEDDE